MAASQRSPGGAYVGASVASAALNDGGRVLMADGEQWIDVRYVGGPHDGRETSLPAPMANEGQPVPLPSPDAVKNTPPPEQPTVYSGPMDQYVLEREGDEWIAVYRPAGGES